MKINFTKKEYRLLIELLEMARWILTSHRIGESKTITPYMELIRKIYSYAGKMGANDIIQYDEELGDYFPTREYEDTSNFMKFIEEFENETFWQELITRLADRDFFLKYGVDKIEAMDVMERMQKVCQLEEIYEKEFSANGLFNLFLQKSERVDDNS